METFGDTIEDLLFCPNEGYGSGLKTRLYYAPASFFFYTPLPNLGESFESEILTDEILMLPTKKLRFIDVLVDENELKINFQGVIRRKKAKTNLSIFILGFKPAVLGFLQRCINEPMVFFIQDSEGQNWQIGHLLNRAIIENAEATTAKKYEENSGASVTISCNSQLFIYKNSLEKIARPGDFNNDFNNDFFQKYYE